MTRRQFLCAAASAASGLLAGCGPGARGAAPPKSLPRVGFLSQSPPPASGQIQPAIQGLPLIQGLKQLGYIEGQNIAIDFRWASLDNDRLNELALELIGLRVNVIVAQAGQ